MALSAIHFLNWFYSFSLKQVVIDLFLKLKKKKNLFEKYESTWPNLNDPFKNDPFWLATWLTRKLDWPDPPILPRLMVFKFEFSTYSHSHIVKKRINISFEGFLSVSLSHTHTHTHMAVLENMKFIPIYCNFMIFNLVVDFT